MTALRLIAVAVAGWALAGCIRENASHCGNRKGHQTCVERGTQTPVCDMCVAQNDGCVAGPVMDPQCLFSGSAPTTAAGDDDSGGPTSNGTGSGSSTGAPAGSTTAADSETGIADDSTGAPPDPCGNGKLDDGEQCDGNTNRQTCATLGLGQGTLGCGRDCNYDVSDCSAQPVCGNGTREAGEQCDGSDLGPTQCEAGQVGPPGCTKTCMIDLGPCCVPKNGPCVVLGDCCPGTACQLFKCG